MARSWLIASVVLAACGARAGAPAVVALRPACGPDQRWDGAACVARTGQADVAAAVTALAAFEPEQALAALERAEVHPLDHASHVTLWEQRGIALGYLERSSEALAAFGTLLTLDPGHAISYQLGPLATSVFEQARVAAGGRGAPALELSWPRDLRLGAPVPLELETVADPGRSLARATVYVRTRGEPTWRAVDLDLAPPGGFRRAVLPAVAGQRPTGIEVYAVASDRRGNEVLTWASAARPREIPLRYEPPTPWYRTWWVWAAAGGVLAAGTGVIVYATQWEPSDEIGGGVNAR